MKNKKLIIIVSVILIVLIIGGIYLFNKKSSNNNLDSNSSITNLEIKNSEVQELYNYVQASLNSNYVCLGYYYQNPFKNHTLEDKISLVLTNYASKYKKKIDNDFLQKISKDERETVKNSSEYYIDPADVTAGMKLIFNLDIETFNDDTNYGWDYRTDVNSFVEIMGGGGYDAEVVQQIIEYNELADEINFTVVKAELGNDNHVYRYVNKPNTLVVENSAETFKFTSENINKFPQLKYIFKKNNEGKYYVSDIINLNFSEDYENCQ